MARAATAIHPARMSRVRRVVLGTVLAVLPAALAFAQASTATIRGIVRDAQNSPIAAATVTVTQPGTGLSRVVPVAADGTFVVANLPPAAFDVKVVANGFSDATRTGVVLEVGQT